VAQKSKLGEPNNFWKYGSKFHDDPWIAAIAAIDDNGDDAPLIGMLLSEAPLDAVNRSHLADLLRRKKLKHKGGMPPTPSYARTFAEEVMVNAVSAVKDLIKAGVSEKQALDQISKSRRIDENDLADAKSGKLGSLRRATGRVKKT
jgi:hypothetical protein